MEVAAKDSLSQSMDNAVKHYASLFKLPSYKRVVLLQALICVGGGLFLTFVLFGSSGGLIDGLFLGFSLFSTGLIFDYIVKMMVLRRDPIYDLRRSATLSLFSWGVWFFFVAVGTVAGVLFDISWWVRMCLLGFSAALILRLIVFKASSSTSWWRLLTASFLQPFSCLIPFLVLWLRIGYAITSYMILFFILSATMSYVSARFFLFLLDRVGEQTLGIPSLSLFKAFLLNWIADLIIPFEEFLEKLGEEHDIDVSLVKFDSFKPKAVIAVSSVHPGPFKNIGSSLLPFLLKTALEKKTGCVACVPLGLQGHELDLASQAQNQKVIDHVVGSLGFEALGSEATPFIKVNCGLATACCQIFGNFALLSFTLAPNTTEDLPQELGLFIRQESEKYGLACCVAVNTHNSINGMVSMPEALEALKTVATACLEKAVSLKQLPFELGVVTLMPGEFGLKDGMGAGGITVIMVKVEGQKTAYVVIDGNNMVSGLREEILLAIQSIGIDGGEIFTTDTHSVSAVVLGKRGYHPVGEAVDHEKLIGYIKKATDKALANSERVKVACHNITVPGVKVIGEKRLETLSLLTDRVLHRAREVVVPIFALCGLVLMLFLLFV
jgi:putative membrane protein